MGKLEAKIKRPMYMDSELFIRYETVTFEYGQGCTPTLRWATNGTTNTHSVVNISDAQNLITIEIINIGRSAPHKLIMLKTQATAFILNWSRAHQTFEDL